MHFISVAFLKKTLVRHPLFYFLRMCVDIQNEYKKLVDKVKEYKDRLSNINLCMLEETRFYPFIMQKKIFYDGKMESRILADSLARVANTFFQIENECMSSVLALFFETHEENSKLIIENIHFLKKGIPDHIEKYYSIFLNFASTNLIHSL
jgi:hypothetical protein